MKIDAASLASINRVLILACGTSWHSALVGKFLIEELAHVPVEVDYGSEYRYRHPLVDSHTLAIAITQSGETADTLGALREAKRRGARRLAICNVLGSMATREADGTVYTHAGPEIGVASTKAFTTQLIALHLFAIHLGQVRGTLKPDVAKTLIAELDKLPRHIEETLKVDSAIEALASATHHHSDFLYLGRGINYPIALEGALKLKEVSYIHAEGYPAGEMKHGPIALIDEDLPVVALAPDDHVFEKMVGNIQEAKARGARVIVVTNNLQGPRVRRHPAPRPGRRHRRARRASALPAGATGDSAAAACVPHCRSPRLRRGPAPQPGEERHRRIAELTPELHVRPYAQADRLPLLELMRQVWPHKPEVDHEVNRRWWWRQPEPPLCVVDDTAGRRLVGLCAYMPFTLRARGQDLPSAWFVDSLRPAGFSGSRPR